MVSQLCQWLVFTVIMGLAPVWIAALGIISGQKTVDWFPLEQLWPNGELMVVTTALAADLLGDLIYRSPSDAVTRLAASCFFLLVMVNALWYALVQSHANYTAKIIYDGSLFLFGLVIGGGLLVKIWLNRRIYVG